MHLVSGHCDGGSAADETTFRRAVGHSGRRGGGPDV